MCKDVRSHLQSREKFWALYYKAFSSNTSDFSLVQDLITGCPGIGPGFKSWAVLEACLLASSRWEPTLHSRPSPSEARLGCKSHLTCFASSDTSLLESMMPAFGRNTTTHIGYVARACSHALHSALH